MKKRFLSLSLVLALAVSLVAVAADSTAMKATVADSEITIVDNDVIQTGADATGADILLYLMWSQYQLANNYVPGTSLGIGPDLSFTMSPYHGNNMTRMPNAQIITGRCYYPFGIHAYANWSGDLLYNYYAGVQASTAKANVQAPSTAKIVVTTYDNSDPWYIARYALANGMKNYVPSDIDGIYYFADRGYIHVQVWQ